MLIIYCWVATALVSQNVGHGAKKVEYHWFKITAVKGWINRFSPFGPSDVFSVVATAFAAMMWDWNQNPIRVRLLDNSETSHNFKNKSLNIFVDYVQ